MSDLSAVTAAPIEIQLGSDTFKMRPLTIGDLGEFENWVRQKVISNAMYASRGLDPAEKRELTGQAINAASRITYDSDEAMGMMQSIEGASHLVYLSLRHDHPAITREQVVNKLSNIKQFTEVAENLMKVSAPTLGHDAPKTQPGNPAELTSPNSSSPSVTSMAGPRKQSAV
ncbi:MAG: hypothetical protein ACF8OB_03055 [Phycisphaeraceae bacterium JB051]